MNKAKIIVSVIVALIVGIVFGAAFRPSTLGNSSVHSFLEQFVQGLKAGSTNQLSITSAGTLTTSGTVSASTTRSGTQTDGGGIFSTTTLIGQPSGVMLATYFDTESLLSVTQGTTTGTLTLTLPASSTLSAMVPVAGDHRKIMVYVASSTGTNLTLAGGTGTTLVTTSSSSAKFIYAGGAGFLDFYRLATGGNIEVVLTPSI